MQNESREHDTKRNAAVGGLTAVQGFPPIYRGFPHITVSERGKERERQRKRDREREREISNVNEREEAA